jgi:anti-sigma B factor antagonist
MGLEHRTEGTTLLVTLVERRLDARSAGDFREKMTEFIAAGQRRIVLDLAHVEFVDSSGLGVLVSLLKQLGEPSELVICGVRETVMSMFKLTRLDKIFHMVARPEDAQAVLAK